MHEVENVRVRAALVEHGVEGGVQRREAAGVEVLEAFDHLLVDGAGAGDVVGRDGRCADRAVAAPSTSASVCIV